MRLKSDLFLLFASIFWGTGFVIQRLTAQQWSALYFNGWRFLLAALLLFLVMRFQRRSGLQTITQTSSRQPKNLLPWMILAGVFLFAAAGLQQAGLATTTIGNASFITGLYVVLVPLMMAGVWKQRISWPSWVAVGIAVAGVMLLSLQGELRLATGDALELAGALMWTLQIILVGWIARQYDNVLRFSVIEFATCGVLNLVLAVGLEPQGIATVAHFWPAVIYSALVPIGLGFTFQIAGQRHARPVDAAIIMSTEAVFSTLFGYIFLGEGLTGQQLTGCALLLAAMILAQVRPGAEPEQSPAEILAP